ETLLQPGQRSGVEREASPHTRPEERLVDDVVGSGVYFLDGLVLQIARAGDEGDAGAWEYKNGDIAPRHRHPPRSSIPQPALSIAIAGEGVPVTLCYTRTTGGLARISRPSDEVAMHWALDPHSWYVLLGWPGGSWQTTLRFVIAGLVTYYVALWAGMVWWTYQ